MCFTVPLLLVLLNTVVGKAGKDMGDMQDKTHTKFWS